MFIDNDSIKIKKPGGNYVSLGSYIIEAHYGYNKLWSPDSGRNLAGKQSGTLIGIFPKIVVQFKRLSKTEMEAITPILDSPKQILRYYDPTKKKYLEMETYTGDYEYVDKGIVGTKHKNEGFQMSFISVAKR